MPRRRPPNPDAPEKSSARRRGGIEKKSYMTRDAARRLRLAKRAARDCIASGGSIEQAAAAAQAFGTPCDGSDSDGSDDSDAGSDVEIDEAEELSNAVEGQLHVADGGGPSSAGEGAAVAATAASSSSSVGGGGAPPVAAAQDATRSAAGAVQHEPLPELS